MHFRLPIFISGPLKSAPHPDPNNVNVLINDDLKTYSFFISSSFGFNNYGKLTTKYPVSLTFQAVIE